MTIGPSGPLSMIACICAGVGTTAWFDIASLEIYI
jgi:hypothetical protein